MALIYTIEVSGEDLDLCIELIDEYTDGGVDEVRQLSGGYYFVNVFIKNDDERDDLENALDNHALEWDWQ